MGRNVPPSFLLVVELAYSIPERLVVSKSSQGWLDGWGPTGASPRGKLVGSGRSEALPRF